jgi:hypothetical protein
MRKGSARQTRYRSEPARAVQNRFLVGPGPHRLGQKSRRGAALCADPHILGESGAINADSVCQGFESCISISILRANNRYLAHHCCLDSRVVPCVRLRDASATSASGSCVSVCAWLHQFPRRSCAEREHRRANERRRKLRWHERWRRQRCRRKHEQRREHQQRWCRQRGRSERRWRN